MTDPELAMMYLGQAVLYLHRAGLLERAAEVQALIRELAPTSRKPKEVGA